MPMVQGGAGGGDEEGLERWGVAGSVDGGMREEGGGARSRKSHAGERGVRADLPDQGGGWAARRRM